MARSGNTSRWVASAVACTLALIVLALPLVAGQAAPSGGRSDARPDIVLVVVDALRPDRLSLYGYPRRTTPNLVSRRRALRWFTDASTVSTHTVGAVASLLTGVPPRTHKILYDPIGRYFPGYSRTPKLDTPKPTLAETLGGAGYETRAFVANPWLTAENGFKRGFAEFSESPVYDKNGLPDDDLLMQQVGDTLDGTTDRPSFVYAHLMSVHNPYDKGHRELVRSTGKDVYVNGVIDVTPRDLTFMSDLYDSNVAHVDRLVGRLIDRLSARRGGRPVVLCIVGDHGEEFEEHGGLGHGTTVYQEQARIPIVFWGPGVINRFGPSAQVALLTDVRGVLLALAGLAPDPNAGLVSTRWPLPAAPGSKVQSIELYSERAVYDRPWKLVVGRTPFKERLFNLTTDPGEKRDRLADSPDVAERLRTTAREWWSDLPYGPPAVAPAPPVK